MTKSCTLSVKKAGYRLDKYVVENCHDLSRTFIQKLISEGLITVNGEAAKAGTKLEPGNRIEVNIPPPAPTNLYAEDLPLEIVYEDADIMVVNKPPGMTTHPSPGNTEHTLVNVILPHLSADFGDSLRPGIVHRLDKDTSGLMIIAKTLKAQTNLIEQFKEHQVKKTYLVMVAGHLSPERGIIEAAIGRHPSDRKRMAVTSDGREARSEYLVLKYFDNDYTLLEVKIETGRTHQIRVHLAAIGFPVIGDAVYGVEVPFLKRQFLHAHQLSFKLPSSGKPVEFRSELPDDLKLGLSLIS